MICDLEPRAEITIIVVLLNVQGKWLYKLENGQCGELNMKKVRRTPPARSRLAPPHPT